MSSINPTCVSQQDLLSYTRKFCDPIRKFAEAVQENVNQHDVSLEDERENVVSDLHSREERLRRDKESLKHLNGKYLKHPIIQQIAQIEQSEGTLTYQWVFSRTEYEQGRIGQRDFNERRATLTQERKALQKDKEALERQLGSLEYRRQRQIFLDQQQSLDDLQASIDNQKQELQKMRRNLDRTTEPLDRLKLITQKLSKLISKIKKNTTLLEQESKNPNLDPDLKTWNSLHATLQTDMKALARHSNYYYAAREFRDGLREFRKLCSKLPVPAPPVDSLPPKAGSRSI